MHSDSYFYIGKAHNVCQDYAINGLNDEQPFGIISDGCSSSPHTDIGSRLIACSFANELPFTKHTNDLTELVIKAASIASSSANILGLPQCCIDATLLGCFLSGNRIRTFAAGDGIIATKSGNELVAWKIEYESSAPEYPNYRINPARLEKFNTEFSPAKKVTKWISDGKAGKLISNCIAFEFIYHMVHNDVDVVAVMSDGINTFGDIQWYDVVSELMNFKSTKGKFVQRRMKRFIKNCQKNGIVPFDDVSMAAICL